MIGRSITQQLIERHLVDGTPQPGATVTVSADQLLLQDTNGPMSFLQFEAMGSPKLQVGRVVAYVDHNVLQVDSRNSDDHRYLETAAARYGAILSKAGNGICHQVHLESFSVPGELLVGTDSHTVLCGSVGMLAFGAGSIQVAVAMGTGAYRLTMPEVVHIRLTGELRPWVTAKDVILELLRRLSAKGGVGKVFEFGGAGVGGLTVPQRATIANMGAELGLTTAVFPSDEVTREFFGLIGRESDWRPIHAEEGASYDGEMEFDLSDVGVLVATPGAPDRVVPIEEVAGTKIEQVIIGSCTNGSWEDMSTVASLLRGQQVHPSLSVVVFPGSRRVLEAMAREGLVADLLASGVQLAATGCGACPGLSHVPASATRSLRTFNRNFPGRSGNRDDEVFLCSPAVAAASALTGVITDPRSGSLPPPHISVPASFAASSGGLALNPASAEASRIDIIRGPNIKEVPVGRRLDDTLTTTVLLKVGDDVSTDHISPVGVQALLLRTNVPAIAEHSFKYLDPDFVSRARACPGGAIVAGANYGQGSSRETAASGLMVLGVRVILATSFARIHRANLVNWGIVPLQTERQAHALLEQGDTLEIEGLREGIAEGSAIEVRSGRTGDTFLVQCLLGSDEREIVLAGGVLADVRSGRATALEVRRG